jgi:hypothetical protein
MSDEEKTVPSKARVYVPSHLQWSLRKLKEIADNPNASIAQQMKATERIIEATAKLRAVTKAKRAEKKAAKAAAKAGLSPVASVTPSLSQRLAAYDKTNGLDGGDSGHQEIKASS